MPGLSIARVSWGHLNADVRYYPVEASQTIYAGDIVVLVKEASNYNTPRVKALTQTEITANFTETQVKGILGIALTDIVTDSSGNLSTLVPSTVDGLARAIYALPTVSSAVAPATLTEGSDAQDKGKARLAVALFNDWTEFWIRGATNSGSDASPTLANATITDSYVGAGCGIQIASSIQYYADLTESLYSSDAGACFVVTGVNRADPNFNTASTNCWIRVKCISAMQQINTGLLWTD